MGLQLVTPAAGLLVTLDEAKLACRIDDTMGTAEDAWLTRKIASVSSQIEAFTGRALMEQGWQLVLDAFSDAIELPRGPVIDIVHVKYDDPEGDEQTLDASAYTLDLVSDPQWIVRNSDADWPELLDAINVVRITFTAGYDETSPVLERVRDVALDVLAFWYEHRDEAEFPKWAKDRLRDLRRIVI